MPLSIVIADDFPLVRDGIAAALDRDPDLEVVAQAQTGPEAVELVLDLHPDVLVTDVRLPGLGGLEVIRRVRAERPELVVVILTASGQSATLLDAVGSGANAYLHKRATPEELCGAVIEAHGGMARARHDLPA